MGLALGVGVAAAILVALGNPGNMGVCGVCFVRDVAASLGLSKGPAVFRPEVAGVDLGALAFVVLARRGFSRSGGFAGMRFVLAAWMAIGAMVFLGCPFRMLQRLGGGDLSAWAALPGFVAGVGIGLFLERRGWSIGKTSPAPPAVGLVGPLMIAGLLAAFLAGGVLAGPGPGDSGKPPHAPWAAALGIALVCGAALSATGFCAVSAARQVFSGPRWMLAGAGALVLGYAATSLATGGFKASFEGQPAAHGDWLWNAAAMVLVGLTGALAGGCPVRQIVMTGEGNADAFVAVAGMGAGAALSHALGLASAPASDQGPGGPTDAGRIAVVVGLVFVALLGLWMTLGAARRSDASVTSPRGR
jgi:YedE family putative selenium metabolism protein